VNLSPVTLGLRVRSGYSAGCDHCRPRRGVWMTAGCKLTEIVERSKWTVGRPFLSVNEATYRNDEGELLAVFEVIEFDREHLAGYGVARSVPFASELSKTGSGEVLRRELRSEFREIGQSNEKRNCRKSAGLAIPSRWVPQRQKYVSWPK
jgi:Zn-finger nucleic acid-binding protein